jgi:hypothetical protein
MSRPFIAAPNMASVEMIYSVNGITAENQFHVRKSSPYDLTALQAVRGIVDTWDSTTWKARRSSSALLTRIRTRALDSNSAPMEDYSLPTPRAGTNGDPPLPSNATYCLKLASDQQGRSQRGRLYVIGMCANVLQTNKNEVLSAYSVDCVSNLNALMAALLAGGHKLVVVSYRHNKAWRSEAAYTVATGWVAVDLHVDSMRRRLTGRGI